VASNVALKKKVLPIIPIIAVSVMVLLAVVGGWLYYTNRSRDTASTKPPSPEAKAYVKNLKLSAVKLRATQSFAGGDLVEVNGKVTNSGDRTVGRAELTCVFFDVFGNELYRDRVALVKKTLKAGQTQDFRLPFDGVPVQWNQAIPDMIIANIEF